MSVLDHVPVAGGNSKENYQFLNGDLSFIDEMNQEKQPMDIDERPSFDNDAPEDPHPPIVNNGEHDEQIAVAVDETATLITDGLDYGLSLGLSILSKGDAETYKATPEQKGRIRKIVYTYCEQTGGYLPLWLQLIILLVGVYGTKIPAALEERKLNILQAKVDEQEKKIKALEMEKRAAELQREIDARKRPIVTEDERKGE